MEHRRFILEPFEREPGHWRVRLSRDDGSAFTCRGTTSDRYETRDYPNSESAMVAAQTDIDYGTIR
jgi:hypothetical protein